MIRLQAIGQVNIVIYDEVRGVIIKVSDDQTKYMYIPFQMYRAINKQGKVVLKNKSHREFAVAEEADKWSQLMQGQLKSPSNHKHLLPKTSSASRVVQK